MQIRISGRTNTLIILISNFLLFLLFRTSQNSYYSYFPNLSICENILFFVIIVYHIVGVRGLVFREFYDVNHPNEDGHYTESYGIEKMKANFNGIVYFVRV